MERIYLTCGQVHTLETKGVVWETLLCRHEEEFLYINEPVQILCREDITQKVQAEVQHIFYLSDGWAAFKIRIPKEKALDVQAIHVLKTHPDYFDSMKNGHMRTQFRVNDRNFQIGDHVDFKNMETGEKIRLRICGISWPDWFNKIPGFSIPINFVALEMEDIDNEKE